MANRCTQKLVQAFERFNADLNAFLTRSDGSDLYEDAFTPRSVKDFKLSLNGKLTWTEDGHKETEQMFDDDEARDYLKFWKANLRRAIRYWGMDTETLDAIYEGEKQDIEID